MGMTHTHSEDPTHTLVAHTVTIRCYRDGTITTDGVPVQFTPRQRDVFQAIVAQHGDYASSQLLKQVMARTSKDDTAPVSSETLRTTVSNIRTYLQQLTAVPPDLIISKHGSGYRIPKEFYMHVDAEHSLASTDDHPTTCHYAVGTHSVEFHSIGMVKINEQVVPLTPQEAKLFTFMCTTPDKVVTWTMAATHLYGDDVNKWPDRKIFDVLMCKIRTKIFQHTGEHMVEAVWGRGSRVIAPTTKPCAIPANDQKVPGPRGEKIGVDDLASLHTSRWIMNRKAIIITLLTRGVITEEFLYAYFPDLSAAELAEWMAQYQKYGLNGLKQLYRRAA